MSVEEAALIYALVGHIAPRNITELLGDVRWGNALYDVADAALLLTVLAPPVVAVGFLTKHVVPQVGEGGGHGRRRPRDTAAGVHRIHYAGQTHNLGERFAGHHRLEAAIRAGATHVLAMPVRTERDRRALETLLRYELRPPLNEEDVPEHIQGWRAAQYCGRPLLAAKARAVRVGTPSPIIEMTVAWSRVGRFTVARAWLSDSLICGALSTRVPSRSKIRAGQRWAAALPANPAAFFTSPPVTRKAQPIAVTPPASRSTAARPSPTPTTTAAPPVAATSSSRR